MAQAEVLDTIPTQVILDPRVVPISIEEDIKFNIYKPAIEQDLFYSPSQNYSDASIYWSIVAPNYASYLDRRAYIRMQALFTITTSGRSSPIFPGSGAFPQTASSLDNVFALRPLPIHYASSAYNVQVNNSNYTVQPNYITDALLRYSKNQYNQAHTNVGGDLILDNYQHYYDAQAKANGPLMPYGYGWKEGRGSNYDTIAITNISNNQSTVLIAWTEMIPFFPFSYMNSLSSGLTGIQTITLQYIISNGMDKLCSVDTYTIGNNGANAVTVTGTIVDNSISLKPTLVLNWLVSPLDVDQNNRNNFYPISVYTNYPLGNQNLAANAFGTFLTPIVQTNAMPSDLYIFAQESKSTFTAGSTNTYLKIENIQLTVGNRNSILSNSIPTTIYGFCVKNGISMSYPEFVNISGSPIKLSIGSDIMLPKDLGVGSIGQFNIQVQATIRNLRNEAMVFDFILLTAQEGIMTISSGSASITVSLLTKADILKSAIETKDYIVDTSNKFEPQGGAISDSLKGLVRSGKSIYSKAAPMIKKYGPKAAELVKKYGPIAATTLAPLVLGLGYSIDEVDQKLGNMNAAGKGVAGAGLTGGSYVRRGDRRMKGLLHGRD